MRRRRDSVLTVGARVVRRLVVPAASVFILGTCTLVFDDLDDYEVTETAAAGASTSGGNSGSGGQASVETTGAAGCGGADATECSADRDLPQCLGGRFSRCAGGRFVSYACGDSACEDDRCGASITITDLQDVTVKRKRPQLNFDGQDEGMLFVDTADNDTNDNVSVLIGPAPSALEVVPPGLDVTYAELRLFQLDRGDAIAVHRVEEDWSEQTVTWNTAPSIEACPLITVNAEHEDAQLRIDLTETVLDWLENGDAHGVRLVPTSNDGSDFLSGESEAPDERLPQLVIYYRELG